MTWFHAVGASAASSTSMQGESAGERSQCLASSLCSTALTRPLSSVLAQVPAPVAAHIMGSGAVQQGSVL